jgi:hypothetical protein
MVTGVGHVTCHLAHGDRVASDQADQLAPGLGSGPRVEGQCRVEVELKEQHQAGAALCLPDDRTELLV